jgi:carotenoid cleavage dioxygenase
MSKPFPPSRFLTGIYAPILFEADAYDLPVRGEIPKELRGTLCRNSPNPQFAPRDDNYHWFIGDGMVHGFFIEDGRVAYRNRWVRTPKWLAEHAAHRALFGSWGNPATTDPSAGDTDRGAANTNVVFHAGRLFAVEEAFRPFELDPRTLASKGYWDFGGALRSGRFTAHPKIDPRTGEMIFFGYSVGGPFTNKIVYGVINSRGEVIRTEEFEAPFSAMAHDFLVTQNYILFPILPVVGNLDRAVKGGPAYAWEPGRGGHIGIVRRDAPASSMRWFRCDPLYVFHGMNAYEDDDRIVAHVMQYEEPLLFPEVGKAPDPRKTIARLHRWTFNLASGSDGFSREQLDDLQGEFPRHDERRATLPYRHGFYAARQAEEATDHYDLLVHYDFAADRRTTYKVPDGDAFSEPVFVPRSATAAEGDGWLLATIYRDAEKRSDLAIFDATALADGPIAVAELSHRVTMGFHGNWIPAA